MEHEAQYCKTLDVINSLIKDDIQCDDNERKLYINIHQHQFVLKVRGQKKPIKETCIKNMDVLKVKQILKKRQMKKNHEEYTCYIEINQLII